MNLTGGLPQLNILPATRINIVVEMLGTEPAVTRYPIFMGSVIFHSGDKELALCFFLTKIDDLQLQLLYLLKKVL